MKIVVLCLAGIGDTLLATPMIRLLKKKFSESTIDVFVMYEGSKKILETFDFINNIVNIDFFSKGYIRTFLGLLKYRKKYDLCITSYPANRLEYNVVSFIIGAKKRIAHDYEKKRSYYRSGAFLQTDLVRQHYPDHNIKENLRLLNPLGIKAIKRDMKLSLPITENDLDYADSFMRGLSKRRYLIGIHAGSGETKNFRMKRWPKDKFVQLINKLNKKYSSNIILFGGSNELRLMNNIPKNVVNKVVIFSEDIMKVAALIKRCDLLISNDSGLFNLGAAVGVKLVGIFGPTDPRLVEPLEVEHKIVTNNYKCSPCYFYSSMNLECSEKLNYECLSSISVDKVLEAVDKLINL